MSVKIGLLSDTHGWLDPKLISFFKDCDEVWHCGDMGDVSVADELVAKFTFRAVYGNIDGMPLRHMYPEVAVFECEKVKVLMTHIGGYPGRYDAQIYPRLLKERPALFVCGHSHITKVMFDEKLNCLHINPGAAGRYGAQKVRTAVRFVIDGDRIKDLELIELGEERL
ncbi:metallophosphatase family protein [Odoribacter sp. OttesenSCG-928-J03]|nr:metallophosphatase family protein [Odoribacter sp. OttesenSCG-928-J03]MDL2283101.1 metallophosphatase family protein [Odoribacter sp. OttesenSCG-928-G04]MDL2331139.1 metallophosphatase family protein [Odoribacter sp. OttesenSCG-928-A06]